MKWTSIVSLLISVIVFCYTFITLNNIKYNRTETPPTIAIQANENNTKSETAPEPQTISDKEQAENMLVNYYNSFMRAASSGEIDKSSALMYVSWIFSEIGKGRPLYNEIENLEPMANTLDKLTFSERQQAVAQAYNRTLATNADFLALRDLALKNAYVLKDCMLRDLKTDRLKVIENKAKDINDKGQKNYKLSVETINEETATLAHSVYLLKQFYASDKDVIRDLWPLIELSNATLNEQIEQLAYFSRFNKELQPKEIYNIEQTIKSVLSSETDANVLMQHLILIVYFMPEMLEELNISPKELLFQTEIFAYNETNWKLRNGIIKLGYEDVSISDLYAKAGVNSDKIQKSSEDIKKLLQVYGEGIGKDLTKRIVNAGGYFSQPRSTVKCRRGSYNPQISIKVPEL